MITYSPVISACGKGGLPEMALQLFEVMLHLIEDLHGPLKHPALPACTDHRTVSDHIGLVSLLLRSPIAGIPTAALTDKQRCCTALSGIPHFRQNALTTTV